MNCTIKKCGRSRTFGFWDPEIIVAAPGIVTMDFRNLIKMFLKVRGTRIVKNLMSMTRAKTFDSVSDVQIPNLGTFLLTNMCSGTTIAYEQDHFVLGNLKLVFKFLIEASKP